MDKMIISIEQIYREFYDRTEDIDEWVNCLNQKHPMHDNNIKKYIYIILRNINIFKNISSLNICNDEYNNESVLCFYDKMNDIMLHEEDGTLNDWLQTFFKSMEVDCLFIDEDNIETYYLLQAFIHISIYYI